MRELVLVLLFGCVMFGLFSHARGKRFGYSTTTFPFFFLTFIDDTKATFTYLSSNLEVDSNDTGRRNGYG
jgi:hypothetical protein